jgi:ABC-type transport system involved in Fe-S cluster assembly fused permease/ATPase subunit
MLVFDEATSALDSITENEITQTIKDIVENRTTHNRNDCTPIINDYACR